MTDKITITITTGVAADGTGGTVVDLSTALLGTMPDGSALLDSITAAFAASYGVHSTPDPEFPDDREKDVPVNRYKNTSYHVRNYMTAITLDHAKKQVDASATQTKNSIAAAAVAAVTVVGE